MPKEDKDSSPEAGAAKRKIEAARSHRVRQIRLVGLAYVGVALPLTVPVLMISSSWSTSYYAGLAILAGADLLVALFAFRIASTSRAYYRDAIAPPLDRRMETIINQVHVLTTQLSPLLEEATKLARQAEQREKKIATLRAQEASLTKELTELRTMSKGQADAVARLITDAESRTTRRERLYFIGGAAITAAMTIAGLLIGKLIG